MILGLYDTHVGSIFKMMLVLNATKFISASHFLSVPKFRDSSNICGIFLF